MPGAQIVALCETNPTRMVEAGRRLPDARRFASAADMFPEVRPDFVEICTGPESHRDLVSLAARHGAHVLCQKPAASNREDLVAMIEACETAGVRLMVHENWRFRPWNVALKAELEAGTIGRPLRLRIAHADTRALRPDGFSQQPFLATRPQLILLEMGCHLIDTARFLLGEARTVLATTARLGGHPGEDLASLTVTFASGTLAQLDMTWCAPPDLARPEWALNQTVLEGADGALSVQTDGSLLLIRLDGRVETRPVALPAEDEVYVDAYRATQQHFLDGLRLGVPHVTDGRDTLATMDVVWAAYRSAAEGVRVIL